MESDILDALLRGSKMKLKHIEDALKILFDQNCEEKALMIARKKDLEKLLLSKEQEAKNSTTANDKYIYLAETFSKPLHRVRLFLPFFEVLSLIAIIIILATNPMGYIASMVLVLLESIMFIDMADNINVNYRNICDYNSSKGIIAKAVEVIKALSLNRSVIAEKLAENNSLKLLLDGEIDDIRSQISILQNSISDIDNEQSFIEGNLLGLECLSTKYQFKDLSEDNSVVKYVNRKLALKPEHSK